MAIESPSGADLVEAFWTHHRLAGGARQDRLAAAALFWAWEAVDDCMRQGDTTAVELIVELAEAVADDDAALCYVGADPIENLLCDNGPPSLSVVAALDRAAEEYASIRTALRCVWWGEDTDPELIARFSRFGGPF